METSSELLVERKVEEDAHKFIIYFLYDDEDQNVFVDEIEEIDFLKVMEHLNLGGSVFITHRRRVTRMEERIYDSLYWEGEIEDSPCADECSRSLGPMDHCGGQ